MEKKILVSGMIVIIALLTMIATMLAIQMVRASKSDYLRHQQHALRRAQEKAGELSLCRAYAETKVGWPPLPGCKDAAK